MALKRRRIPTKQVNTFVGRQIKSARKEAGLTQEEMARLIGHSKVYVNTVEHGRSGVKAADLLRIAGVTEKKIDWFFPG